MQLKANFITMTNQECNAFSMQDALKMQSDNLVKWQSKLTLECFNALDAYCQLNNIGLKSPWDVKRGSDLSSFIENFTPKQQ